MFQPQAKIIADSVNLTCDRLTTFVLTYHRLVHSEFLTHRMLSKNSSSSRAIPVEKMIAKVIEDNVFPLEFGKNQKGMTAKESVDDAAIAASMKTWQKARLDAIDHAWALHKQGVHKQVVNRLLEPFSSITVICTATEYQNFFAQRCHPDAQPEIQALAIAMREAYEASEPDQLEDGDWHIPFLGEDEKNDDGEFVASEAELQWHKNLIGKVTDNDFIKIATGRCARVSYLNHDGIRNIQDDIKLHDRLLSSKPPHLSPFEHCAMALGESEARANFVGFESYRYQLEHNYEPTEAEIAILSATEEEILQMQSRFKDISIETLPRRKR
jgi:thymidylate synthase ThyX